MSESRIPEKQKAIDQAESIIRASKYGVSPDQLGILEASIANGMHGIPAIGTRDPKWMMNIMTISGQIGQEKTLAIISGYTSHRFPKDTSIASALEQLPSIAREQAIDNLKKETSSIINFKKEMRKKLKGD